MHCWLDLKLSIEDPSYLEFHSKFKYAVNLAVSFVAFSLQVQDGDGSQGIKILLHVAGIGDLKYTFWKLFSSKW